MVKFVFGIFMVLDVLRRLLRQRLSESGTVGPSTVERFSLLVWVHIVVYWVVGLSKPHGSQTGLMLSILSIGEIVCDLQRLRPTVVAACHPSVSAKSLHW